jgi:hypothetical protein
MHVDSPGMLWIKLRSAFERAYEEPINEDLIARIYAFADWCVAQVDEPDLDFHLYQFSKYPLRIGHRGLIFVPQWKR